MYISFDDGTLSRSGHNEVMNVTHGLFIMCNYTKLSYVKMIESTGSANDFLLAWRKQETRGCLHCDDYVSYVEIAGGDDCSHPV